MDKKMQILEKLAYFQAKADELYELQKAYQSKAESFDAEYADWTKTALNLTADRVHPCHIQKATIEATIEL